MTTFIAVILMRYILVVITTTPGQYHFLEVAHQSVSVCEAAQRSGAQCHKPAEDLLADLYLWLPQAWDMGCICYNGLPEVLTRIATLYTPPRHIR